MKDFQIIDNKKRVEQDILEGIADANVNFFNQKLLSKRRIRQNNVDVKKEIKRKEDKPGKTIETMFRITSANSQKLSDQADTKSHIMISVNTLIVSLILALLARHFQQSSNLTIPLTMLLAVSLTTIALAIMATKPNIPKGTFTKEDLKQKKINLLFFGNFYKMNFEDYSSGMFEVMNDREFLYLSLLRDIYCQGVVLGRKYRMLKAAYYVFMFGLIVSVIAFLIAIWL